MTSGAVAPGADAAYPKVSAARVLDITKAFMKQFRVSFEEAETLKRQIGDSRQAEKILKVLEGTLNELTSEVQRLTFVKLAGAKWADLGARPVMPMSLNLREMLCWAWLVPGPKSVQLAVELGAASADHCTHLTDDDVEPLGELGEVRLVQARDGHGDDAGPAAAQAARRDLVADPRHGLEQLRRVAHAQGDAAEIRLVVELVPDVLDPVEDDLDGLRGVVRGRAGAGRARRRARGTPAGRSSGRARSATPRGSW